MKNQEKLLYLLFIVLAAAVNLSGIHNAFFTDDQGLYASIAKTMLYKGDVLSLYSYNVDWLDKPHFPFWMIAASFKVFGISTWAYRLPALLFFAMGVWYTYLLARKFYTIEIALTAVSILLTAQYILMGNTDIRAEPYLIGLIAGAVYHISCLEEKFTFKDLLLAGFLTACAVMTKGIFVLVVLGGGLLGQLFFTRKIGTLFSLKWIALLILTILFTLPELYALYVQFDMHPEKTVFDRQQVSGIKWFLWDSQFGRFVNNGPISQKRSGDVFFYLHTLLWAFAPWCLLFYFAIYKRVGGVFKTERSAEYYTISGGLLLLLLFSLSRFQLPFYTNIIFPLFAIITAPYCFTNIGKWGNILRKAGWWLYAVLFTLIIFVIHYFMQPATQVPLLIASIIFAALIYFIKRQLTDTTKQVFFIACAATLFANFYLNTTVYPTLTAYNGQITAARYINQTRFAKYQIYSLKQQNNVFQFECKKPVDYLPLNNFNAIKNGSLIACYAGQSSIDYLKEQHIPFKTLATFTNYPQEQILPAFVNKNKRHTVLDKVYLITK